MKLNIITNSLITVFILVGCSNSSNPALSLENCGKNGNFCYKGINYGPVKSEMFKRGIKDGCRTAEGFFTKNYYLSSSNKDYYNGWIEGRSHCKQILPNEGTKQEEENSRKRAEYEINKLKQEQSMGVESSSNEEGFIDKIMKDDNNIEEVEY